MIYQILKFKKKNGAGPGVTLLLAVLILSALLAISFSLATITFIEIRTSGDLTRTEPSLYGASAIVEEALFNIRRGVPNGSEYYDSALGNVTFATSTPVLDYPITQIIVPPNSTFANTTNHYPIYDVQYPAPTGDGGGNPTGGSNYGKVQLTYLNTGNDSGDKLQVYLCQYDPRKGFDPTGADMSSYNSVPCTVPTNPATSQPNYWLVNPYQLSPLETASWGVTQGFDYQKQQELILVNPTSKYIYVQLQSFDINGVTGKGLPFFSTKVVDITASNGGIIRKLRTVVPPANLGGSGSQINAALNKIASQSSTAYNGDAAKAVDGNTDGVYNDSSVTHTNADSHSWWQVDLGSSFTINSVNIYNRTDCCSSRLGDYWVFISNTPFNPSDDPAALSVRANTWSNHQTTMPNPSVSISVPSYSGRYVRIQLVPTDYLSLAEVQVIGQ